MRFSWWKIAIGAVIVLTAGAAFAWCRVEDQIVENEVRYLVAEKWPRDWIFIRGK